MYDLMQRAIEMPFGKPLGLTLAEAAEVYARSLGDFCKVHNKYNGNGEAFILEHDDRKTITDCYRALSGLSLEDEVFIDYLRRGNDSVEHLSGTLCDEILKFLGNCDTSGAKIIDVPLNRR
jgi:hypothetical protein